MHYFDNDMSDIHLLRANYVFETMATRLSRLDRVAPVYSAESLLLLRESSTDSYSALINGHRLDY